MSTPEKPPVHLWIYNHPFYGISDQVDFFVTALAQHGYAVSVGRQPSPAALNVVIENFTTDTKKTLVAFCRSTRKRVAMIMTEHLDFDGKQIFIHGDPLWSDNDYMHPAVQLGRIKNLMDCLPYIRGFLVLGDLPELRNIAFMLPVVPVHAIPFPQLDPAATADTDLSAVAAKSDLLFTGIVTDFRAHLLSAMKARGLAVNCPQKLVSRKMRNALNQSAKIILNIPQRKGWRWLSLMRVIAGLRCGRATVSLGTMDDSLIARCCTQLQITEEGWTDQLTGYVGNWRLLYRSAYENYMSMAVEFEREKGFPHDLFEYWAITDTLDSGPRPAVPDAQRSGATGMNMRTAES